MSHRTFNRTDILARLNELDSLNEDVLRRLIGKSRAEIGKRASRTDEDVFVFIKSDLPTQSTNDRTTYKNPISRQGTTFDHLSRESGSIKGR